MINSTAQELYSFALFFMFNLTELRAPHEQTWAKDKGICLLFYQIVKCYIAVKCLHTPIFLEYFEQQLWLDLELGQRRGIIFSHFYPDCWRCPFTHVECKLHYFFFYNFFYLNIWCDLFLLKRYSTQVNRLVTLKLFHLEFSVVDINSNSLSAWLVKPQNKNKSWISVNRIKPITALR